MFKAKLAAALGLAAATISLPTPAAASDAQLGYITDILAGSNGAVLFYTSGARDATPGCHTVPMRFAIDASSHNGQNQVAVLLTAYAQRKRIFVRGRHTCDIWGDTETVDWFATEG